MSPRAKCFAALFSSLLCGLILWPINQHRQEDPVDSFPLSYYPMFTQVRGNEYSVRHPMLTDINGRQYQVPFHYAGTGGFNQIRRQISRTIRERNTLNLCRYIFAQIEARDFPTEAPVQYISIVTSVYDMEAYYRGELKLLRRYSHIDARIR